MGLSAVLVLALLLVLGAPTWEDSPAHEGVPPTPSMQELRLLQELAQWVGGDASSGVVRVADGELTGVVRSRRRSFELFRSYHGGAGHEEVLRRLPFGRQIQAVAAEEGFDGLLVAAVVRAESRFDPRAISPRGALGLMQLMPETAARYGVSEPLDPVANLRAGVRYLRHLLELYGGDLELALAAYNAGPGAVARHGGVPPFRETLRYVDVVLSSYVGYHRRSWGDSELVELLRTLGPQQPEGVTTLVVPATGPAI
jgi:soluble lytic murein transglycosylase-like protein